MMSKIARAVAAGVEAFRFRRTVRRYARFVAKNTLLLPLKVIGPDGRELPPSEAGAALRRLMDARSPD